MMDNKNKKLFPQRLWDLIHDTRYNHFLRWSEDGQRVYLNRNDFEEQYLRTPNNQFHTQKAISFVRQMNMYGFKKVDDCHYENDHFKRDCHHLIKNMVRRNSNRPHLMPSTSGNLEPLIGSSSSSMRRPQPDHNRHMDEEESRFSSAHLDMSHNGASLLAGNRPTSWSDEDRFMSELNERQNPADITSRTNEQGNLMALYRQISVLNQIPRLETDLNQLAIRMPNPESISSGLITGLSGDISNIAQSSLASTLYQRMTAMTSEARNIDAQERSRFLIPGHSQLGVPNIGSQLSANMTTQVDQQQQQGMASNIARDRFIASMLEQTVSPNAAAQQILQQTLIRSLMQLKLAQMPQNYELDLLRNLGAGNNQQIRPSCSLQSMGPTDTLVRHGHLADGSSSSTSPVRSRERLPRHLADMERGPSTSASKSFGHNLSGRRSNVMLIDDGTDDSVESDNACVVEHDDELFDIFGLNRSSRGLFTTGRANLDQQSSSASMTTQAHHHVTHQQGNIGINLVSKNSRSV